MTKTLNVLGEFEIFSDPNALLHERFSFEIGLHPSDYFRDLGILTQRAPSPYENCRLRSCIIPFKIFGWSKVKPQHCVFFKTSDTFSKGLVFFCKIRLGINLLKL